MKFLIPLTDDSYNVINQNNPAEMAVRVSSDNETIYLKVENPEREVAVKVDDLRRILGAIR